MKHDIRELYKVISQKRTILATSAFIEQYQIPSTREAVIAARAKGNPHAVKATHYQAHNGYAKVYTANSVDLIWMYGEKTWFDTKEERDTYRASKQREG